MVNLIQQFVSCCRAAGLRISTAEILDCLNQLQLIEVTNELQFRVTLKANFAKSMREINHFDRLYHLFFHEMRVDPADVMQSEALAEQIRQVTNIIKKKPHDNPMFDAVVDFIAGNPLEFLKEMRRIQTASDSEVQPTRFNFGPLADRFNILIQITSTTAAIAQLLQDPSLDVSSTARNDLADHFTERFNAARSILLYEPRPGDKNTKKLKLTNNV